MPRSRGHLALVKPAPPVEYRFNERDLTRFQTRFYSISRERVESGFLADIRHGLAGVERPGASCVLPILALNSWPKPGEQWSPSTYLSTRTIAALAGLDKNTTLRAMARLEEVGLLRMGARERMPQHGGAYRRPYQLHADCFPAKGHRFFRLPGTLFYGGTFAMLPVSAARHLLLVVAALDPLYDEAELREHMAGDYDRDVDASIVRRRHESTATFSRLVELSGLAPSTTQEALRVLMQPVFHADKAKVPTIPLVRRATGKYGLHYYVAHDSLTYHWDESLLNDRADVRSTRARYWGAALGRAAA